MPKPKPRAPSRRNVAGAPPAGLPKAATGVRGFDAITGGGLPAGRPTLVCGGPGCGKTMFAMEFLIHGIEQFGEPGVFVAFEETAEDLAKNVASLGHDLARLQREKRLAIDHVRIDPADIEETGTYTLDGLFVRLELAVRSVGAKRVVIDTLEVLFGGLKDTAAIRAELTRLFRWLKENDLTAVVTAEAGDSGLTRHALEEYVSDCVIVLDQKVDELIATRRMRVVKYRGSSHGSNEYPFLIDDEGISVMPMTSVHLDYAVDDERVSTGVPDLDDMLGGHGWFRTSTILISGSAGTGKSSLAACAVEAACGRGERALLFALEESPSQVVRNMRSIGVDLARWCKKGLLKIVATRPSLYGLEMHLVTMHREIEAFDPRLVVIDPVSSLSTIGASRDVKSVMVRLFDALKLKRITGCMTYLNSAGRAEETDIGISSLIDTWIEVRDLETQGERTRGLFVIKSRGMAHSNQVREFVIGDDGIRLLDVVLGPGGAILTGSARAAHDAAAAEESSARAAASVESEALVRNKRSALEAQIAAMQAQFEFESDAIRRGFADQSGRAERERAARRAVGALRTGRAKKPEPTAPEPEAPRAKKTARKERRP